MRMLLVRHLFDNCSVFGRTVEPCGDVLPLIVPEEPFTGHDTRGVGFALAASDTFRHRNPPAILASRGGAGLRGPVFRTADEGER